MQDQLKHWRSKISSNSQEWEDRNASLLAEKKSMSRHYQSLKSAMDSFRGAQGERLKQLSLQVLQHTNYQSRPAAPTPGVVRVSVCKTLSEFVIPPPVVKYGSGIRAEGICAYVQAQSAEEDLNGVVKQAEGLLKLAEMCRRLETEQASPYTDLYMVSTHGCTFSSECVSVECFPRISELFQPCPIDHHVVPSLSNQVAWMHSVVRIITAHLLRTCGRSV